MLDKCSNPACSASFRSLRDGKLFVTEVEADYHSSVSGHQRLRQYFWLCNSCCRSMTITVDKRTGAHVVPLPESAIAAQAAS